MSEKETFPSENEKPKNQDGAASAEEIKMFNDWAAADASDAARRLIDSPVTIAAPPRPQVDRRPAPQPTNGEARPSRSVSPGAVAGGLLATGAFVAGSLGIMGDAGGNETPDRGEVQQNITSVSLDDEANIRNDPYVSGQYDTPNLVGQPEQDITIQTPEGVRVEEGTNNGTWYGFEANQIPNIDASQDKDGIVWVNEAGVTSVDKDDTQVAEQQ